MGYISVKFLSYQAKQRIRERSLSKEELIAMRDSIVKDGKKDMKICYIVAAVFSAFLAIMGLTMKDDEGKSLMGATSILASIVIIGAVTIAAGYVSQVLIIKLQFNKEVRKAYPEFAAEIKA